MASFDTAQLVNAAAQDAAHFANSSRAEGYNDSDLREAAVQDASRIATEEARRLNRTAHVNLDTITPSEAKIVMSEEHKVLNYRPPKDSLAAKAQAAAAKHDDKPGGSGQRTTDLKEAARADAARIATERGDTVGAIPTIDLTKISKDDAAKLMSEEHKRLGHRPPAGSLAAQAQSVADKISVGKTVQPIAATIDLSNISKVEAALLQSEEHKRLGHLPPSDSLAAQAQSAADKNLK